METLEDLLVDPAAVAAVKQLLEGRLRLLYHDQANALDEWNDAIDSAIRMVVRS